MNENFKNKIQIKHKNIISYQKMYKYQKPVQPPVQIKQIPFLGTSSSLIQSLMKSKMHGNIQQSFNHIKKFSINYHKKSVQFSKLLNKITTRKELQYKKLVLSVLHQIKITDILTKRQKVSLLKDKCKNQSVILISGLLSKNLSNKLYQSFHQLKFKSQLMKQRNSFKFLKLINSIKNLQLKLQRNGFKLIKIASFNSLAKYKRCFVIEKILSKLRIDNLSYAISELRKKPQTPLKQKQVSSPNKSQQQNKQTNQANLIKQLQQQKKALQTQLNQIKTANRKNLQTKQSQLQKAQQEYESLRFSFDLMAQQNTQIAQTIKQRQRLTEQAQTRKQQFPGQKPISTLNINFNQNDLWKNVFDNVMEYLYKVKIQTHGVQFNYQTLIQKMTEPLISLSVYTKQTELQQQNQVLRELLQAYKQVLGKPVPDRNSQNIKPYPLQILNKQRRYLYLALQCLSRWGTSESQGLQQIKSVLQKIKNQQQNEPLALSR